MDYDFFVCCTATLQWMWDEGNIFCVLFDITTHITMIQWHMHHAERHWAIKLSRMSFIIFLGFNVEEEGKAFEFWDEKDFLGSWKLNLMHYWRL